MWHYAVGTERPHISRTLEPIELFFLSSLPLDFVYTENQAPIWKLIPP